MSNAAQLLARERILSLLDNNSFVEIGTFVTKRNTDFNLSQKEIPSDGVITGYGIIDGTPVYVYSQDAASLGGSVGEMHAKKITNIYDLALKAGAPVIGLIDSAGLRLEEAYDALNGFGEIYLKQTLASGVIPQITAVFGKSGGGLAVLASLSDFCFMEEKNASLFVNSPNAIRGNYKEKNNTSSAEFQAKAGTVDYVEAGDREVLLKIRELVSLLPSNFEDNHSYEECTDNLNRLLPGFDAQITDPAKALRNLSDHHYFFEIKEAYAPDMVTGFIRLNGQTIGAVANRAELLDDEGNVLTRFDEVLSTEGCEKASSFIRFCDAFHIPVLSLTNVNGFKTDLEEERTIAKAAAKLTHAFADATVPKVNLIVGKAFGSSYLAMNSKHIGADLVFALPNAKIGMMDAGSAVQIIYNDASQKQLEERTKQYEDLQASAMAAARRGYVDSIIEPDSVRKNLIYAFEMLFTKCDIRPAKKHGTI